MRNLNLKDAQMCGIRAGGGGRLILSFPYLTMRFLMFSCCWNANVFHGSCYWTICSGDLHQFNIKYSIIVTWYGRINYIINYLLQHKLLKPKHNRSNPKFFKLLWNIVIFRLVAYLLNMICLNLRFLYKTLNV